MATVRARSAQLTLDDYGISPTTARWRARLAVTLIVCATALLTAGVGLLVRVHPQWTGLFVVPFVGAFVPILAPLICQERGESLIHRGRLDTVLTARTMTGYRTVNLSHLRRVRYVYVPGKFRSALDLVVVTDVRGVRVGITSRRSERVVAEILKTDLGRGNPGPRISRGAAEQLGLIPPGPEWRWFLLRFFGTLALVTLWALAAIVCTISIAIA